LYCCLHCTAACIVLLPALYRVTKNRIERF
jgi:hypothetical protein